MTKKIIVLLLTFSLFLNNTGTELITGNEGAPAGTTFSFPINKNIMSPNGTFYTGTNENLTQNQQFALAGLIRTTSAFAPLAPEIVTLNGVPGSENPLYGQQIIGLALLETEDGFFMRDMPIVVGANRPATVYLLESIAQFNSMIVVPSGDVHDAAGKVSSGIVGITTNGENHVFAAVKPNAGEFGDLTSGIALLARGSIETGSGDTATKIRVFGEVNANTGSITPPQALLLDPTSPAIAINAPLASIVNNQVTMHWDAVLKRLYIGLQTTANSGANDGTRAVVACRFIENGNGSITLETVAPDTAFAVGNTTSIIGAIGAGQQVSMQILNTMYTSTALNYLIVVGNVGNPASTQQSVFALPLVNAGNSLGMIADKNAQPEDVFSSGTIPRLIARSISTPATDAASMTQSTDIFAQVGGGQLTAGPIVNLIIRDDTVFALVAETTPGIYSSQAIFDATGKISSWTQWQRAAGTTENIFGAALNAFDGNFILATGTTADTVNTIQRTIWSDGSPNGLQPLTAILDTAFPPSNAGIQGMQTFLPHSAALQNIAVLAAGGIGTVVLAQTGILNSNGIIMPTAGADFNQTQTFSNGTITTNVDATTVIISGGALTNVGPITALTFAQNASNGWFFVGGSNGLAVLANPDGSGWDPTTELGNNFAGLTNGMRFITIGDYSFISKLIYDGNFLFVVSHNKIDRIDLVNSDFGSNTLAVTTIATTGANGVSNYGGFLDGIFSQACAVIATTDGLLRLGNGKDVRTISSPADAQWTEVAIGENAGAPSALYAVTSTNQLQDITKNQGGYFYVLTANAGLNQSRINRFAVQPLATTDTMSASTIQAFDDLFVKNIPSFLLSFGEFRSHFATDGALYFATRNEHNTFPSVAMLTPGFSAPRVGVAGVGDRSAPVKVSLGTEINYFDRSAASGSWIAAGNFNTQVLE